MSTCCCHKLTIIQVLWCGIIAFCWVEDSLSLLCHVSEFEVVDETDSKSRFYACNPIISHGDLYNISETHYTLELTESLQEQYQIQITKKEDTYLSIPDGEIRTEDASIFVPDPRIASFVFLPGVLSRRKLEVEFWSNGARLRVLPIRILTNDGKKPSYKADDLYKYIFADTNSLKWQFHRCSVGKLTIEPTSIGVLNVNVDQPASIYRDALVNEATTVAIRKLGDLVGTSSISSLQDYADLIMFITPPMDGWVALGFIGGRVSVYNDKWGAFLGVQMHEIGHNFDLFHANQNAPYQDHTGAMGSAILGFSDKTGFPLSCYNSYNNWSLGWYKDRAIVVDPTEPRLLTIAAFVDYSKTTSNQNVLVSVDNQLFMQYNRAKDFNSDTYEYKDCLVIVRELSGDLGTNLVAALDSSDSKYQTGFIVRGTTTNKNLIVEVCSTGQGNNDRPDYLTVSIGFDQTLCGKGRRLRHY